MFIAALFILGLAVGCFGTLVGIGGGLFLVPFFILVLQWTPQQAAGTSLAVVFFNALSGSIAYIRQQRVYYDAAWKFSVATLPGAFLGGYLIQYFSGSGFRIAFGGLLMLMAVLMLFRSAKKDGAPFDKTAFRYNQPLGIAISAAVGFLSSILGIGGGVIHVPAMVVLLGFPAHVAAATSHFVLALSSLFGVVTHYFLGNVVLDAALAIGAGAVIGAQAGAKLSLKVRSKALMMLLAFCLFALGLRMVLTAQLF